MITYIFLTNNYSKSLPIIFGHLSGFLVNESTNARDVLPSVVISFLSLKISYVNSIVEVGFFEQKTLIKKISPKINGFINFNSHLTTGKIILLLSIYS